MNLIPSLLLLSFCCIHHERLNEMKIQNYVQINYTGVFILRISVNFPASLSVFPEGLRTD